MNYRILILSVLVISTNLRADGPADNLVDKVRPVPPPGIKISETDRQDLQTRVGEFGKSIDAAKESLARKPALSALLSDVQIYHKAVDWALRYDEFYRTNEVQTARTLLQHGEDRLKMLLAGEPAWNSATGLVARGYVSKIDGSIQPYGLIVPASYRPQSGLKYRLDFWFHGRVENLTELSFVNDRERNAGEFTPANAFVLHLYGRYCNANKFAGEVDLFEALDDVKKHYPIDENRLIVRGFSMGGAACWQFAAHYPGLWAAAAPGAGFSETPDFLKVFQKETLMPSWFEQKLWNWYDATNYAINFYNLPTVAYSGEIDGQKQAADIMATALATEGLELTHIIGPKTPHRYHPDSKIEINRRIDSIADKGRNPIPTSVKFTTWTLLYNQCAWVSIDGMGRHWDRARLDANLMPQQNRVVIKAANVTAMTLSMDSGRCPLDVSAPPQVEINGQSVQAAAVQSDRSWKSQFHLEGSRWAVGPDAGGLRKRHGLQGPIDDAFMDSFIVVKPTGSPLNEKVGAWTTSELNHAVEHWRRQYRGEARVVDDTAVTDEQIKSSNLILFGDTSSNQLLKRIADQLPIKWNGESVIAGAKTFEARQYVPVFIHPNPLNTTRYVVLNSGFTFREYDYLNNARQNAKLPDYAIMDISVPVNSRFAGGIAAAGFFDEQWRLK